MRFLAMLLLALLLAPPVLHAQGSDAEQEKQLEHYRAMINDPMGNPGYFAVDRGEQLWHEKRGTKNVSLETCDLGMGPGKLEGAYAHLPRYFADTNQVMDLEQRLLFCMTSIQGLDTKPIVARHFSSVGKNSDLEDLATFIANKSNGMKVQPSLSHPQEREMLAIGEAMFFRRSATNDFACATCHAAPGKRIRLQNLPNLSEPSDDARASYASWPAYRVSQSTTRTMQHRLWDCYRQMRMPVPAYASEGLTAMMMFLAKMGEGGVINVPSIKR